MGTKTLNKLVEDFNLLPLENKEYAIDVIKMRLNVIVLLTFNFHRRCNMSKIICLLIFLCSVFVGCSAHYGIRQVMSTSELMEKVGPPQEVRKGLNDTEIWVYTDYPLYFYYYIRNGYVVDKRTGPAPGPF